jgi:hypothetical protein
LTGPAARQPAETVLLQHHTVENNTAAPPTELVECLQRGTRGHLADPPLPIGVHADRPQAVRRTTRHSVRLPEVLKESVHQILSWTLQKIRHL